MGIGFRSLMLGALQPTSPDTVQVTDEVILLVCGYSLQELQGVASLYFQRFEQLDSVRVPRKEVGGVGSSSM